MVRATLIIESLTLVTDTHREGEEEEVQTVTHTRVCPCPHGAREGITRKGGEGVWMGWGRRKDGEKDKTNLRGRRHRSAAVAVVVVGAVGVGGEGAAVEGRAD